MLNNTIEKSVNLDYGFDYYAPQSFLDKHGNRVLMHGKMDGRGCRGLKDGDRHQKKTGEEH